MTQVVNDIARKNISEQYQWKLSDLFSSVTQWQQQKKVVEKQIADIAGYKGKLGLTGAQLLEAFEFYMGINKEFMRLYAYAVMLADQDTRESEPLAMKQSMLLLETKLREMSSYIEPEILTLREEQLADFFNTTPGLEVYRQAIHDIHRRKKHTLPEREEKLVAQAGLMSNTAQESYNILSNADLPYPVADLSVQKNVRLDPTNYAFYRVGPDRRDRKKVFETFFAALQSFKRTFGIQLSGELNKNIFYKNVRNYDSCLASALDRNNIPVDVYYKLIEKVNLNLDTLHRYFNLRKKILGLDKLYFYDIYASLIRETDLHYSYEEATDLIKDSLQILGDEYNQALDLAFNQRWIDVYPNAGKRSGAYMDGIAYDVHPYILMNYKGKYNDVTTLTHELGHAMHSYFSNKYQPFVNSQYPIFLAEVASTVNEALLIDHVLKKVDDKNLRLALLGDALEGFRGTLFRQTQFAEYEMLIHEKAEAGQALTGDMFSEYYLKLFRKYYGHEQGITVIDDLYAVEWAFIPHFYYNFYVFQYSTSFTAAQAIADKILSGDEYIVPRYIEFLSSGCSDYAIPTLQKVGLDMTGDEPMKLAIRRMNKIMDEIDSIIE